METQLITQLRFYEKKKTPLVLVKRNYSLKGHVSKAPIYLIGSKFEFTLEDDSVVLVYLDEVIDLIPNTDNILFSVKNNRKGIPKSIKLELWENYYGKQFEGKCQVCKARVERDGFEAGHVVAVDNGGTDTLDNLRVICFKCNRSMGTDNLDDFKAMYH